MKGRYLFRCNKQITTTIMTKPKRDPNEKVAQKIAVAAMWQFWEFTESTSRNTGRNLKSGMTSGKSLFLLVIGISSFKAAGVNL